LAANAGGENRVMSAEDTQGDASLAGSGGDDVSAGTSVSGVGGEALRVQHRASGLKPVAERAAEVGWGRDLAELDEPAVAGNDGTGQSEKPAPG
jgi:hypothetical protein